MNHAWNTKLLGDVATLQRGFDLPHRLRKEGDVPIVTSSGFEATHSDARVRAPGVVTGRYGTIGQVFFVEVDFWPLNTTLYVRDFHGNDPLFVSYLLRTIDFHTHSGKSGVPGVNRNDLHEIIVSVPATVAEQQAIATALSDADALIEALEQLLTKKRQIKQGAMQELLTGQRRLPGFAGVWNEKPFADLFKFSGGFTASRDQLGTEGYCYLHYGDIHLSSKTFIDVLAEFQDIPKLNLPIKKVSSASLLEDGDVVFVDASEDDEGTSKHVVVSNPDKVIFISGLHTIVAKSVSDELDHRYKRYCFQTRSVKTQFRFFSVGTKVSGISKTNIGKITLLVPPIEEQAAIAAILSDMDAEITTLEAKLRKARYIKQGMMQELLTGRIRLVQPHAQIISFPAPKKDKSVNEKPHNQPFEEAVMLAVLAKAFGSEQHPLARVRRTKLLYLLHRHIEGAAEGYLKKAAGPYNPKTRYQGAEGITVKNGYVRAHHNGTYEGFVAGDKIEEAEVYFDKWYEPAVRTWLDQFHYMKTEELELLATVDMAMEDLRREGKAATSYAVKQILQSNKEWQAKLEKEIFSDANIARAIQKCHELFSD